MLEISDRALAVIDEVRTQSGAGEGEAIVLFRQDSGVGFAVRTPAEGDQVITRHGGAVVAVSAELAGSFDGCVLDFVASGSRGVFTLRRPSPAAGEPRATEQGATLP